MMQKFCNAQCFSVEIFESFWLVLWVTNFTDRETYVLLDVCNEVFNNRMTFMFSARKLNFSEIDVFIKLKNLYSLPIRQEHEWE